MKNNSKLGTLVALLIVSVTLIYFNTQIKEKNQKQVAIETTIEANEAPKQFSEIKTNNIKIEDPKKYIEDQKTIVRINQIKNEFETCFEKSKIPINLINDNEILKFAKEQIQQSKNFSEAVVEKEQFSLKSVDEKLYEVQYINGEDDKNKVRVFRISQFDGFPDRVNDFPNSTAEIKERLSGALSLGQIVVHTVSDRQMGLSQESLEIEKTSTEILSIHYKDSSKEFLCEKNSCKCSK